MFVKFSRQLRMFMTADTFEHIRVPKKDLHEVSFIN